MGMGVTLLKHIHRHAVTSTVLEEPVTRMQDSPTRQKRAGLGSITARCGARAQWGPNRQDTTLGEGEWRGPLEGLLTFRYSWVQGTEIREQERKESVFGMLGKAEI
jgi:hypothetical protein